MMKKIISYEKNSNKKISIEKYFLYFIKFVSCVIPNLEFDFTTET